MQCRSSAQRSTMTIVIRSFRNASILIPGANDDYEMLTPGWAFTRLYKIRRNEAVPLSLTYGIRIES